jgi:hypothetical protein
MEQLFLIAIIDLDHSVPMFQFFKKGGLAKAELAA